jgi:hypothetical protein
MQRSLATRSHVPTSVRPPSLRAAIPPDCPCLVPRACPHTAFLAAPFCVPQAPKVAVVFSVADAATRNFPHLVHEGELSALVEAVNDAEAALVVPNTYGAGSTVAAFVKALPRICSATIKPTFYALEADAITAELESEYTVRVLESGSLERALRTDGTTFLYVALSSASDASLSTVMSLVQKVTHGDFIAFAVPAAYDEQAHDEEEASAGARMLLQKPLPPNPSSGSGKGPTPLVYGLSQVRITPNIMLGLLVSVFLVFVLHLFFSAMMDIRPNDKHWLSEIVPLGNKVEM